LTGDRKWVEVLVKLEKEQVEHATECGEGSAILCSDILIS
jgi:hypothetical protein